MDTLQTACWSVIRSKIQKQNTEIKNTAQICAVFFIGAWDLNAKNEEPPFALEN